MSDKKTLHQRIDLHLKDYKVVRSDVDGILDWSKWIARIIIGAVIVALLAVIGLK